MPRRDGIGNTFWSKGANSKRPEEDCWTPSALLSERLHLLDPEPATVNRPATRPRRSDLLTGRDREKATILIADDDPDILRVTAAILNRFGYEVVTAGNGEAALKAFEEAPHAIHLVISDVVMPGMKGPQLVHSIKGLSPSIATLLMSGTWGIAFDCNAASIEKPFKMPAFLGMVKDLLAGCDFAKIEVEQSIAKSRLAAATAEKLDEVKGHARPRKAPAHPL